MIRCGFLQYDVKFKDIESNVSIIESYCNNNDFDLLVLPEACFSGYEFESKEEVYEYAEDVNSSAVLKKIHEIAKKKNAYICGGFFEKNGSKLYNSAFLIGSEGIVGIYRKTHLFLNEKELFLPGDTGFEVFDTKIGKLGMMICFDWYFPESARTLAKKGAQIILHPSNLVLPYCQDAMITRSLENRVFSITANRIGKEKTLKFTGKSQVVSPWGERLLSVGTEVEGLFLCNINPDLAKNKNITPKNSVFDDLREDMYI